MTRYVFKRLEGSGGRPDTIALVPFIRAAFENTVNFEFHNPPGGEAFSSRYFSSTQVRLIHRDAPGMSPALHCIYSVVSSGSSQLGQELEGGDGIPVDDSTFRECNRADREPFPASPRALMLTPLSDDGFRQSCISSGRLLHVYGRGEYVLAVYLW
jgi:hypothetical protein